MKKASIAAVAFAILFFTCGKELNDNPYDPDYGGDYRLEVVWDSLSAAPEIFHIYHAPFTVTGADAFARFEISGADSAVFADSSADSSFALYFVKPGRAACVITGVHHNGDSTVLDTVFNVVNPYRIAPDSLPRVSVEETAALRIVRADGASVGGLDALWSSGDGNAEKRSVSEPYIIERSSRGVFTYSVSLHDAWGNEYEIGEAQIEVIRARPVIDSVTLSDTPVLGDTISFTCFVSNAGDSARLTALVEGDTIRNEWEIVVDGRLSFDWKAAVSDTVSLVFQVHGMSDTDQLIASNALDTVIHIGYVAPRPSFSFDSQEIPTGDSLRIEAPDTTKRTVQWIWRRSAVGAAETTGVAFKALFYEAPVRDTILVGGLDEFGSLGPIDTMLIEAKTFEYQLNVHRPAGLWDGYADTLIASVQTNRILSPEQVSYVWSVPVSLDTTDRGDTLIVRASGPGRDTLSVIGWIGGESNSTNRVSIELPVWAHRPVIALDSTVYRAHPGDMVTVMATVRDTNPGGGIDAIFRRLHDTLDTLAADSTSWPLTFDYPGVYVLAVRARDNDQFMSDTFKARIEIVSEAPVVTDVMKPDTMYYKKAVSLTMVTHTSTIGGEVVAYHWDFDGDTTEWDTTTQSAALAWRFADSGAVTVTAACTDEFDKRSAAKTTVLNVNPGLPRIIDLTHQTAFVRDTIAFFVQARDNDNAPLTYAIASDSFGALDSNTGDSSFMVSFTDAGQKFVRVSVSDTHGMVSDSVFVIPVLSGAPVVDVDSFPGMVWMYDTVRYTVSGNDPNNRIVQWAVQWQPGAAFETRVGDSAFFHAYSSSGEMMLQAYASDEYGISSDTVHDTITVLRGAPAIASIAINSAPLSVFVNDNLTFSITGSDPNPDGTVDSILISWNGDALFEERKAASANAADFSHAFASTQRGEQTIRVRVIDDDAITTDSTFRVNVRLGAPVIDSIVPDTVWVVDTNDIHISASDSNGYIIETWVDWDTNGVWDDSSTVTDTFTHAWDTTFGGKFATFRAKVMDDDSLTTTALCSVFVRLGRPVVGRSSHTYPDSIQWVDGNDGDLDTMFYRFSGVNTLVIVGANDTDGVVDSIYWYLNDSQTPNRKSSEKTLELLGKQSTKMIVRALDNNRLLSKPYTFWVYPDEPPPAPSLGAPTIQGDSVRLVWENADAKDGDSTYFQILCDTNNPPSTVIKEFGTCKKSGTEFYYWFKPPHTGTTVRYRWRVRARDARGSEVNGDGTPYFDFP